MLCPCYNVRHVPGCIQDRRGTGGGAVPPLQNGNHLSGPEFERRWDSTPGLQKAELIEGVVYMAPAVSWRGHGLPHYRMIVLLGQYS